MGSLIYMKSHSLVGWWWGWARIPEWVAIPFSKRSSWPSDRTQVSRPVGRRFTAWATREVSLYEIPQLTPNWVEIAPALFNARLPFESFSKSCLLLLNSSNTSANLSRVPTVCQVQGWSRRQTEVYTPADSCQWLSYLLSTGNTWFRAGPATQASWDYTPSCSPL